jgi:hypothetical protein
MENGTNGNPDVRSDPDLHALISVLAALYTDDGKIPFLFPTGDVEDNLVVPFAEAVGTLSGAKKLPGYVRLEVLAQLLRSPKRDEDGVKAQIRNFAQSLFTKNNANDANVTELIDRLERSTQGADAFRRTDPIQLLAPEKFLTKLEDDIATTAFSITLGCDAKNVNVNGTMALSVGSVLLTKTLPLQHFYKQVNPKEWPHCGIEQLFFKSMTDVTAREPLVPPDTGWKRTLCEEVDFGLGGDPSKSQYTRTNLEFVVFEPPTPNPLPNAPSIDHDRWGCTYDLVGGGDGKITVDQGFVLVEDLLPELNLRRLRTLKIVYFNGVAKPGVTCPFWSMAAALIAYLC